MHECPDCGEQCDCDGADHQQPAPEDCKHTCEPPDDSDDWVQYDYED